MNDYIQENEYYANAFISCSLSDEDKPFVDFICEKLKANHINPMGTVGKFSVKAENTIESMKNNIKDADFVVICATPRYAQKNIHNNKKNNGMSEMVHTEAGMAIALEKPVVTFAKKGTYVGGAIANITQYIELTGTEDNYKENEEKISSLINDASLRSRGKHLKRKNESMTIAYNDDNTEMWATFGKFALFAIAVFIIFKIANNKD